MAPLNPKAMKIPDVQKKKNQRHKILIKHNNMRKMGTCSEGSVFRLAKLIQHRSCDGPETQNSGYS
jgi:hypothetical protein